MTLPRVLKGKVILKYALHEIDLGSLLAINSNEIRDLLIESNARVCLLFISKCLQYPLFSLHISVEVTEKD